MEEVHEFKYLGIVLHKCESMESDARERAWRGRQVMTRLESYEGKKCKHEGGAHQ